MAIRDENRKPDNSVTVSDNSPYRLKDEKNLTSIKVGGKDSKVTIPAKAGVEYYDMDPNIERFLNETGEYQIGRASCRARV